MARGPRLVFLGKQGSGKGTQAGALAAHYGVIHLSTGDMFRAAVDAGTARGLEVKQYLDRGDLVPDATVVGVVEESFARDETLARGFILDGFPRTRQQAVELQQLLGTATLDAVVELAVPDEVVLERMLARGRADDTHDTIRRRLELYSRETAPLTDFYRRRGVLVSVEGSGEIEDITKRMIDVVDESFDPARP